MRELWENIKKRINFKDLEFLAMEIAAMTPKEDEYAGKVRAYSAAVKDWDRRKEIEKLFRDLDDYAQLRELGEEVSEDLAIAEEELRRKLEEWDYELRFSGPYDDKNVYLSINAGSGGTEAQDWAEMLSRMYIRWGERQGFKVSVVDVLKGEVAGIKNITIKIEGDKIYGRLKGEHGVHRLVRVSPFDAKKRRHTSFAAVEVLPILDALGGIELDFSQIEIQTFRSGGPGGQYQNTTDSGCRLIHKPTGIVVESRQERSQFQNRSICEEMLKGKLIQMQEEQQKEELDELNEKTENGWGHAIRSYVFMPYQLVKDNRTGKETGKITDVLDGNLEEIWK